MTENFWEHRSFAERGLDIEPEIHLGEKAAALERAGVHTIRGDINRDIRERNIAIQVARAVYDEAVENLEKVKSIPGKIVENIKNEILDMIHEVARRYHDRLQLPIVSGKYLRLISNRSALQSKEKMENFITDRNITTFAELKEYKSGEEKKFENASATMDELSERISYLKRLLSIYNEHYEPLIKFNKEYWAIKKEKGWFAAKVYKSQHNTELMQYDVYRDILKERIKEPDKKIVAWKWKEELEKIEPEYEKVRENYNQAVVNLASCEVIEWNKKDLERVIKNESKERTKKRVKTRE